MLMVACSTSSPEQKQLIGTWSEPYHVNTTVKSITFDEKGKLLFQEVPDTTWEHVIDWTGITAELGFSVKKRELCISSRGIKSAKGNQDTDYAEFEYYTSFSIDKDILVIDSFSVDGGQKYPFTKLILKKGYSYQEPDQPEPIPTANLSEETEARLQNIFDYDSNTNLQKYPFFEAVVIHSSEELQNICLPDTDLPNIDFANQCLIFVPIETSSVNDQWLDMQLFYEQKTDSFVVEVSVQKCIDCYTVIGHICAYGVYEIAPDRISKISCKIEYIED